MQYHFDELIDRRNTDSIKWDHIPENPDAIPMWVADMDFRCPKPVIDRVLEKAAFGVYAYTATPPAFRAATAGWQRRRHLGHWRGYGDSHLQRGTGPLHRRCGVYGAGGSGHSPAACLRSVYRRRNTARERSLQQRPPAAAGAL